MNILVNGVKLYYECFGEGEDLLLITGNGTSIKYMKKLALLLSKEYKVYLIDRRGQGKSQKNCELSYELNVQDIYEFIQKLNICNPVLIGHSGGAVITMMFAIKYKNIAKKIILCSGSANLDGVDQKTVNRWKLYSKLGFINPKVISMVLSQKDIKESIQQINVSSLVLAGNQDIITNESTQNIARQIPKTKLKIYENENHSSYITNAVCYKDIINFLKEE